jgi:hypothetical protein
MLSAHSRQLFPRKNRAYMLDKLLGNGRQIFLGYIDAPHASDASHVLQGTRTERNALVAQ